MSKGFDAAMKRARQADAGEDITPPAKPAKPTYEPAEKSLPRKIAESSLYDWKPTARALLTQLAVLAMDEDSDYPDDAPDKCKADKVGWCWMSQFTLGLRVGCDENTVYRWIKQFRKDGVILYRDWYDDNKTHHAEYKVVESVVDAFQRNSQKRNVNREPRYKEKRPAPKQPRSDSGKFVKKTAVNEEDDE